jgi:uncharacterized membrane protein
MAQPYCAVVSCFAAIMWVGQTFYFTWLDGQFGKLEGLGGQARGSWMVHSGGFYTVEKQKALRVAPGQVHWFRWESAMTWLSGMVLMFVMYYFSSGFIDTDCGGHFARAGVAISWGCWFRLAHLRP